MQRKPYPRDAKLKSAEVKIVILIITYMCVALHSNLSANITLGHVGSHAQSLQNYFICESFGDPGMTCSRDGFGAIERDSYAQTSIYLAFALYPSIFFIFLLSPSMCGKLCRKEAPSVPPVSSSTASPPQA